MVNMNYEESALRLFTIYFLDEVCGSGETFTRFYKKELSSRYSAFCQRNRQAAKYSFRDIFNYLKRRKIAYMTRKQIVIKPLFVNTEHGRHLVFTVNPGSEHTGEYFVCQVCDRGFASEQGLFGHQASDFHQRQQQLLSDSIPDGYDVYSCPMLDCPYQTRTRKDLIYHFTYEKSVKVSTDLNSPQVVLRREKSRFCQLCCIKCTSENSLKEHEHGKKHKINEFRELYRENRRGLIGNKGNLEVVFECDGDAQGTGAVLALTGGQDANVLVVMMIVNKGPVVTLESCKHFHFADPRTVTLSDLQKVTSGSSYVIPANGKYAVHVTLRPTYFGKIRIPILFTFQRQGIQYKILREVVYKCVTDPEVFKEIQPVAEFVRPELKAARCSDVVTSNFKPSTNGKMALEKKIRLSNYSIPRYIKSAVTEIANAPDDLIAEERREEMRQDMQLFRLELDNYTRYFDNLLYLEEHQMEVDIAQYTMDDVPMRKDGRTRLLVLQVPGLAENRPSVLQGDKLYAIHSSNGSKKYEGHVHKVEQTSVKLGFNEELIADFINSMKFCVEFTINRLSLRLEHRAVWEHLNGVLQHVLFPSPRGYSLSTSLYSLRFFNPKVESNHEQQSAVKHIVSRTSGHAPYLIYGPPGTGKTFTMVEAIKQNAAADLLAKRLMSDVDQRDILRLNAPSRSFGDVENEIQKISNYSGKDGSFSTGPMKRQLFGGAAASSDMEVEFPRCQELKKRKIIVSTLVTSGRLVSADMKNHFTHIFIDEAGHATEPETVIPLAGLISQASSSNTVQVVLAGDPKQLGPVIRSSLATQLEKSLLERLMARKLYQKSELSGQFNEDYVTKLVRSFRSHPEILEVPNACFYENELQAHADEMQRERFCNWEGLPKRGFPLIFHGVNGDEQRESNSPSWFNNYEVMQVIAYVKKLMECKSPLVKPQHIGIISPYHQQVNKITRGLKALEVQTRGRTRNYAEIKVGSVEKFQGDEREIIIISTVRSQDAYLTHDKDFNLGFVGNPKRFNVAVTRAKALLIVIGNPSILRRDKNWLRLISHIEEGGGYIGTPPPDEVESEHITDLTNMMEAINIRDILRNGVSEYQQQGDQEWRRKDR